MTAALSELPVLESPVTSSWIPIDLTDVLNNVEELRPTMLVRQDGVPLIYAGKYHDIKGEPGSGKSWMAMALCAEQIKLGHNVLYIDYEDHQQTVVPRMLSLGVTKEQIQAGQFVYIRPDDALGDPELVHLDTTMTLVQPVVVVIDGITGAMGTNGCDINDNGAVTAWFKRFPQRLCVEFGAAVVGIDHVTKSNANRGAWALGAQAKKAVITGASYSVEVVKGKPLARGRTGVLKVAVDKDRPGWVLGQTTGATAIAEFFLRSDDEGNVNWSLEQPSGTTKTDSGVPRWLPTRLMERASQHAEDNPDQEFTKTSLRTASGGNATSMIQAIDALIANDYLANDAGKIRFVKRYRDGDPVPNV